MSEESRRAQLPLRMCVAISCGDTVCVCVLVAVHGAPARIVAVVGTGTLSCR